MGPLNESLVIENLLGTLYSGYWMHSTALNHNSLYSRKLAKTYDDNSSTNFAQN